MDAVIHRRQVVGISNPLNSDNPGTEWDINFPASQQEVEAYFTKLNGAVPEELWDWNDKPEKPNQPGSGDQLRQLVSQKVSSA